MNILRLKQRSMTDPEIIEGLQSHNRKAEKCFFDMAYRYFNAHFNQLFFDGDSKQEVFQTAIIKLWTEIENRTITEIDGMVCRRQKDGRYHPMTASLNTFMMAFAKNEFRELLRNHKDDNFEDVANSGGAAVLAADEESGDEELKISIIDECILAMSPNCRELITLFYHQNKSLDDIMQIRESQNTSKDGLKTAKNKCMVSLRKRVTERLNSL